MNRDVYLFEFDISHSGQKGLFQKKDIDNYFKSYLLIADHIYLQASAPMKIREIYNLFLKYELCVKNNNLESDVPLVSFVLNNKIYSYQEYLEQRLSKLSDAHIDPKKNFEYNAYRVNDAEQIVTTLDKKIIFNNSGYYFKKRDHSADKLFRRNVSLLFSDEDILKQYNIDNKYNAPFFQDQ